MRRVAEVSAGGEDTYEPRLSVRRRPLAWRLVLLGIGGAIALLGVLGIEVVFKFGNDHRESRTQIAGDDIVEFYAPLGYRPKAGAVARVCKTYDGTLVYDVHYTFDAAHRRVTPARPNADEALVVLGDSFVFGEGVADDATLPWHLAASLPDVQVYNRGYSGYGPQQALAWVRDPAAAGEFEHERLTAIYVFIPGHVRRAIGAMRMWVAWGRHFPCYDVAHGEVVLQGSFVNARPWRSRVYDMLGRNQTLRYFHVDWPLRLREEDFVRTARILAAAQDALRERHAESRFRVVLFPDMPNNEFHPSRMLPYLIEAGLDVVDLSDAVDMRPPGMALPGDGHPTSRGYAEVAESVLAALQEP